MRVRVWRKQRSELHALDESTDLDRAHSVEGEDDARERRNPGASENRYTDIATAAPADDPLPTVPPDARLVAQIRRERLMLGNSVGERDVYGDDVRYQSRSAVEAIRADAARGGDS